MEAGPSDDPPALLMECETIGTEVGEKIQCSKYLQTAYEDLEQFKQRQIDIDTYMQKVIQMFGKQKFHDFLNILNEIYCKKTVLIEAIGKIADLFEGNHELVVGFSLFLPGSVNIKLKGISPGDKTNPLAGQNVGNDEPGTQISRNRNWLLCRVINVLGYPVYKDFVNLLHEYKCKKLDVPELVSKVASLFQGHPDLLEGFNIFLPDSVIIEELPNPSPKQQSSVDDTEYFQLLRDLFVTQVGKTATEPQEHQECTVIPDPENNRQETLSCYMSDLPSLVHDYAFKPTTGRSILEDMLPGEQTSQKNPTVNSRTVSSEETNYETNNDMQGVQEEPFSNNDSVNDSHNDRNCDCETDTLKVKEKPVSSNDFNDDCDKDSNCNFGGETDMQEEEPVSKNNSDTDSAISSENEESDSGSAAEEQNMETETYDSDNNAVDSNSDTEIEDVKNDNDTERQAVRTESCSKVVPDDAEEERVDEEIIDSGSTVVGSEADAGRTVVGSEVNKLDTHGEEDTDRENSDDKSQREPTKKFHTLKAKQNLMLNQKVVATPAVVRPQRQVKKRNHWSGCGSGKKCVECDAVPKKRRKKDSRQQLTINNDLTSTEDQMEVQKEDQIDLQKLISEYHATLRPKKRMASVKTDKESSLTWCGKYCKGINCQKHCIHCHQTITVKADNKGYCRFPVSRKLSIRKHSVSIESFLQNEVGYKASEHVGKDQFVCYSCCSIFNRIQTARENLTEALFQVQELMSPHSFVYKNKTHGYKNQMPPFLNGLPTEVAISSKTTLDSQSISNSSKEVTLNFDNQSRETGLTFSSGVQSEDQSAMNRLFPEVRCSSGAFLEKQSMVNVKLQQSETVSQQGENKRSSCIPEEDQPRWHVGSLARRREKTCKQIGSCKYLLALRSFAKISACAEKALQKFVMKFVTNMIKDEMKSFVKKYSFLQNNVSYESLKNFQWTEVLQEFNGLPWLSRCLKTAMCKKSLQDKQLPDEPGKLGELSQSFGHIMALILHARNKRKYVFIPGVNSLQMYHGGCGPVVFRMFHKVGFCYEKKKTRALIATLEAESGQPAVGTGKQIENWNTGRSTTNKTTRLVSPEESTYMYQSGNNTNLDKTESQKDRDMKQTGAGELVEDDEFDMNKENRKDHEDKDSDIEDIEHESENESESGADSEENESSDYDDNFCEENDDDGDVGKASEHLLCEVKEMSGNESETESAMEDNDLTDSTGDG